MDTGKNCYSYLCNPGSNANAHRPRLSCMSQSTFEPCVVGLQCRAEEFKGKDHTALRVVLLDQNDQKEAEASPRHFVLQIVPLGLSRSFLQEMDTVLF